MGRTPHLAGEHEKEGPMGQQGHPLLRATGAEINERGLVPAVFAPWVALLILGLAQGKAINWKWSVLCIVFNEQMRCAPAENQHSHQPARAAYISGECRAAYLRQAGQPPAYFA